MGREVEKWIDLSNLPKKNGKCNKVDWNKSIGCTIMFKYGNIEDEVTIVSKANAKVVIYNEKYGEFIIDYRNLIKCKLAEFLKKDLIKYEFNSSKQRYVDLRNVPIKKGNFDWGNSIGVVVPFRYDEIHGTLKISDYLNDKCNLAVEYNKGSFCVSTDSLKNAKLGYIVGKKNKDHIYSVNDIVETRRGKLKILNTYKEDTNSAKCYKYECQIDGYIGDILEGNLLKGKGCSVCANMKVIKGVNDISITHPHMLKYFKDVNIAYKNRYTSKKDINSKCPLCGAEKKYKISSLCSHGFSCDNCGDGISYPEKIMRSVLEQLNISYETYKRDFEWLNGINREYDFYIPSINTIIETHGMQHYKSCFKKISGIDVEEQQRIDAYKKELALKNNINCYVELDCRYSNIEYIKNSIINSKKLNFIDTDKVDWNKCEEFALNPICYEVAKLFNEGFSISDVAIIFKLSEVTIRTYLVKMTNLNKCSYNANEGRLFGLSCGSKSNEVKCICLDNGLITESIKEMANIMKDITGINFNPANISSVCNGRRKTHKGYKFEHYKKGAT